MRLRPALRARCRRPRVRDEAARLLQRERDFLRDEKARLLGHVAMAAERDDEVRLHAAAEFAIVGVADAAELRREAIDGFRIRIADARDGDARRSSTGSR